MTPKIKRLVIDAALSALINFVIGQAMQILREDWDAMRKTQENKDE